MIRHSHVVCHELSPTLYMYVPGTELGLPYSV